VKKECRWLADGVQLWAVVVQFMLQWGRSGYAICGTFYNNGN